MYRRIVAGYQDDDRGRAAIELACALAEPAGAAVTVATVIDAPEYKILGDILRAARVREARAAIEAITRHWPLNVKVESRVLAGRPAASVLQSLAEEERADILVVGSTHRGRFGQLVLGSTGENLLRDGPCAVAIAPRGYERPLAGMRRVLVAGEESLEVEAALTWIASNASPLAPDVQVAPVGSADLPTEIGEPARGVDLVILGSRGPGQVRRLLLGSISASLAQSCSAPVVVLPRGDEVPQSPVAAAARA